MFNFFLRLLTSSIKHHLMDSGSDRTISDRIWFGVYTAYESLLKVVRNVKTRRTKWLSVAIIDI